VHHTVDRVAVVVVAADAAAEGVFEEDRHVSDDLLMHDAKRYLAIILGVARRRVVYSLLLVVAVGIRI
jgi:hypothetical protein